MSKRKPAARASKPQPPRGQRYLIPDYEPPKPSTASDALSPDGLPGDVQKAIKDLAARLSAAIKDNAKRMEHRHAMPTPARSGATVMETRRVFLLEEDDVDALAASAANDGFMLALEHYAADLLKNESVRTALVTGRDKANAARLAAKLEKRKRILDHIARADAEGRTVSVTQACRELGISQSTGHDAMNHDA
jgi:hypothetical protein